jgi:hypothetical protein
MSIRFAPALAVALLPLAGGLCGASVEIGPMPRCHTADLHVYLGRAGAAAGSLATEVGFRNQTRRSCFVYGYAGFGLESKRHHVKPSVVIWGNTFAQRDPGRHRVVLSPGRAAFANLAWSDVPVRGEGWHCGGTAAWLQVTPPDERRYRLLRFDAIVCDHGRLTATALSRTRPAH